MKAKLVIAVVAALLILAQIIFGGKKTPPNAARAEQPASSSAGMEPAASVDSGATAPSPIQPAAPKRPAASDVLEIAVGAGDGALRLERVDDGWDAVGSVSVPADAAKVEKLLSGLVEGDLKALPESARVTTGLENDGDGLPVRLTTTDRNAYEMRIGLRPEGTFDSTYVRLPGGGVDILAADIRGELGLWKNTPEAAPDPSAWLEKETLSFDPRDAIRLEAVYPDHRISFEKSPEGEWEQRGYVPGGEWDRRAFDAWLRDLSRFRISGVSGPGELPKDAAKLHEIKITLADGTEKAIRVSAGHGGEGMLAESSDYPGHMFHLPDWRFRKYFRRLAALFPNAVPHFDLSAIRFLDIRQGGETVKIANKDNAWQAATTVYPLRAERVERLARMLSAWRPEDYAAPDFKAVRPLYAGPMVDVILDNGNVHQYRLVGRHPLFPWRYVILDNSSIFTVTDAEAGVMFPDLAEVLDLGKVLPEESPDELREIRIEEAGNKPLLTLRRKDDGFWEAEKGSYRVDLHEDEDTAILENMLDWHVAGFHNMDARPGKPAAMYHVLVTGNGGVEQVIQFLEPEERDIPYILEGHRAFLLDRKDFFNWLNAVRELDRRIRSEQAEAEAAAEREAASVPEDVPAETKEPEPTAISGETPPLAVEEVASETEEDEPEPAAPVETPEERAEEPERHEEPPVTENSVRDDANVDWENTDPAPAAVEEQPAAPEQETNGGTEEPVQEVEEPVADEPAASEPAAEEPAPAEPAADEDAIVIIDPLEAEPDVVAEEPPVDIPLSEHSDAPDSDLVNTAVPEESPSDIFAEEGKPVSDAVVERFIDGYIGPTPDIPDVPSEATE